jgi:hypothetical protein
LLSSTGYPVSLFAKFKARATNSFAYLNQVFVYDSIAVIIYIIAYFACDCSTFVARISLSLIYVVVAVIIFEVAYFFFWLRRVAFYYLAIDAKPFPRSAYTPARIPSFIGSIVTVVI